MRAVNLIPDDVRKRGSTVSVGRLGVAHVLIGLMAVVLGFVAIYVFTSNTISQRQAQLVTLHEEVAQAQAQAARLTDYAQFEQLAQAREATVSEIASSRFDWHTALTDLAKVMPANATLHSLSATVASGSGGGSSSSSVRGDIDAPAFALSGCTQTQDDVARLASRLRVINGVTRVTIEDSTGASGVSNPGSPTASATCGGGPSFDMVVFFQPVAGAAALAGPTQ